MLICWCGCIPRLTIFFPSNTYCSTLTLRFVSFISMPFRCSETITQLEYVFMLDSHRPFDVSAVRDIKTAGHSRVPVYDVSRSKITSILLVKRLIGIIPDGMEAIGSIVGDLPVYVSASMPLYEVLNMMQTGRTHLAIVVKFFSYVSVSVSFTVALTCTCRGRDFHPFPVQLQAISSFFSSYSLCHTLHDSLQQLHLLSLPLTQYHHPKRMTLTRPLGLSLSKMLSKNLLGRKSWTSVMFMRMW